MARQRALSSLLCLLLASFLSAQTTPRTGVAEGTIFDESGGVLPGASVVIHSAATKTDETATSDGQGAFRATIPSGPYTVRVSLDGFAPLVREDLSIAPGETQNLRLVLRLSAVKQEVVVTGAPQAERSESTTILTREDMNARNALNINDYFLSGIPGVSTARRSNLAFSGPGAGFFIRGLTGTRVVVFVDGVPNQINSHFHPRTDQYSPDQIERVEITRGPSPVLHGAGAIGGAIDIFTRTPNPGFAGFLQAEVGELKTHQVMGDVSYGWKDGSLLASFNDRDTDAQLLGEEFPERNLSVKLTQSVGGNWTAGFRFSNVKEYPSDKFDESQPDLVLFRFRQNISTYVGTVEHKSETSSTLLAVHLNQLDTSSFRETINRGKFQDVPRVEEEYGFFGRHSWFRSEASTFIVGLEAVGFNDRRTNAAGTAPKVKNSESFVSPNVYAVQKLGSSTRLEGGVRWTHSSQFGDDVSPELGLVQNVGRNVALRARGGKAFRVPRVDEVNAPFATPNPDLQPEDFYFAEVGGNVRLGSRTEADVAVWWRKGDNLIQTIGAGTAARSVNTGKFEHQGVEASVKFAATRQLGFFVGAADMDVKEIASVPQKTVDAGVDFHPGRFRANVLGRWAYDNTTPILDDYFVGDARFSYYAGKGLTLLLDIDNFTDEKYATLTAGNTPIYQVPRIFLGGVRFAWGQR
jgi:outer membrane receptor protein involved in Fe transport